MDANWFKESESMYVGGRTCYDSQKKKKFEIRQRVKRKLLTPTTIFHPWKRPNLAISHSFWLHFISGLLLLLFCTSVNGTVEWHAFKTFFKLKNCWISKNMQINFRTFIKAYLIDTLQSISHNTEYAHFTFTVEW